MRPPMSLFDDLEHQQLENSVNALADDSVNDFRVLVEKIQREQRRNDVQSQRIKALTALCEKLVVALLEKQVLGAEQISSELVALKQASAPKKV